MADTIQQHVKNYVPNIMVLSGEPESRKELVYFAHIITKNNGLQTCINIIKVRDFFPHYTYHDNNYWKN